MAVRIQTAPTFAIGAPKMLFAGQNYRLPPPRPGGGAARAWDLARDGRFLMVKEAPGTVVNRQPGNIVHVQNWFGELRRLVPPR
jgi:hypothetical protein